MTDAEREIKTLRVERSALITTLNCSNRLLLRCYKEMKRIEENQGSLVDADTEEEIVDHLTSWGLLETEQ